ncbi:hypothetical protein [Jatrophihabitans sp.]|uniref:hypothetical protein n=1 Tax=Jatrophihabitans sp. TaxID=1932789 RepID=UPI0030C6DFF9|nr:hypothetical protein [Jatrophihabitans sp.]
MEPTAVRDLDAVRRRRAELRESIALLRSALAAPSAEPVVWGERVQQELARLALDFIEHVEVTEGPAGLHESVIESSPRLSHAVDVLTAEHEELEAQIAALSAVAEAPVMAADVEAITAQGSELVGLLVKHRQRGADLVYEAFQQDLGTGD